jgi:dTDP-3-amino-3,4,6-trideoxy-alpha-D-glucose transaminase
MLEQERKGVPVPFLDLSLTTEPVRDAFLADLAVVLETGAFTNGDAVSSFEREFADYCHTQFCIGVANGLDALRLGLLAAGLEPGDEVIVPANTFIATLEAVSQAGGVPVPVDVLPGDYNVDVDSVAAAITSRTRFLLPVHLYGQMADMPALHGLARRHELLILEDACQAHGAARAGLQAGAGGSAGAFSFYPGKNLGAFGDGGALVTDDEDLAARVRALREHGQRAKYEHDLIGYTSRLDTIQAIVLLHKLPFLDTWNNERRRAAAYYTEYLDGVGDIRLPSVPPESKPVWHLYVIRTSERDALARHLHASAIATGLHYPQPVHLAPAYAYLGYGAGAFPVSETLADEILSLPIFPGITEEQLSAAVKGVRSFFDDAV